MSFKSAANAVSAEYKELQKRISGDMEKIITNVNTINRIFKDYPSLLNDGYGPGLIGAMKDLHEVKKRTGIHVQCFNSTLQSGENMSEHFEEGIDGGERSLRRDKGSFAELQRLQAAVTRETNEDEVEMVEAEECNIDPLTRAPIKKPVRNKRCHHLYCETTILPYIRSITFPRCPIAGCSLPHIREDDLVNTN